MTLDVPYFGHTLVILACLRFLFSCLHCGFLWLDKPYLVDEDTMHNISSLPRSRENVAQSIKMSWALYILNDYVVHCLEAQDIGKDFHYIRVILLLAMFHCRAHEVRDFDIVVTLTFLATKFNIWKYSWDKSIQKVSNVVESFRIMCHLLDKYAGHILFETDAHNLFFDTVHRSIGWSWNSTIPYY